MVSGLKLLFVRGLVLANLNFNDFGAQCRTHPVTRVLARIATKITFAISTLASLSTTIDI